MIHANEQRKSIAAIIRDMPQAERRAPVDRAIVLTHSRLIDAGQLILKGAK